MYTKPAVLALLLANASATSLLANTSVTSLHVNEAAAIQIVKGVLEGAVQAEGFSDIGDCIKDDKVILEDAEVIIKDLEDLSAQSIITGVRDIGVLLEAALKAISMCKGVVGDFEKLAEMTAVLSNPASFTYHVGKDLIINGRSIYKEVNTAVADYKKEDYEGFGFNLGEAASKTLLGAEQPKNQEIVNTKPLKRVYRKDITAFV